MPNESSSHSTKALRKPKWSSGLVEEVSEKKSDLSQRMKLAGGGGSNSGGGGLGKSCELRRG